MFNASGAMPRGISEFEKQKKQSCVHISLFARKERLYNDDAILRWLDDMFDELLLCLREHIHWEDVKTDNDEDEKIGHLHRSFLPDNNNFSDLSYDGAADGSFTAWGIAVSPATRQSRPETRTVVLLDHLAGFYMSGNLSTAAKARKERKKAETA